MSRCIFHVGMPKTGTTSVQESLHTALQDPRFRYADFGHGQVNANRAIATLFADQPCEYFYHQQLGLSKSAIARLRLRLVDVFDKMLIESSAANQTLIVSAEIAWSLSEVELMRFRDFVTARAATVNVVGYLRDWKPWLESEFQQVVKMGIGRTLIPPNANHVLSYQQRIESFKRIFGEDSVEIRRYAPASYPDHCMVKEFCQHQDIKFDPAKILRSNESLSLPAIQLLYTFRKFGSGFGSGRHALVKEWALREELHELKGPPVRFHCGLLEPLFRELAPQRRILENLFDYDFANCDPSKDIVCISQEEDLLQYDPSCIEWLNHKLARRCDPDPQSVADAVQRLRNRPSLKRVASITKNIFNSTIHQAGFFRAFK
jgi:hypothetical protein